MLKTKSLLIAGIGVVSILAAEERYNLCSSDYTQSAIYLNFTGGGPNPMQLAGWEGLFKSQGFNLSTGVADPPGCPALQGKVAPILDTVQATFEELLICAQAQVIAGTALKIPFYLGINDNKKIPTWILKDGTKLPNGTTYTTGMALTSAREDAAQKCAIQFQEYCGPAPKGKTSWQPTLSEAVSASNDIYYPGSGATLQSYCGFPPQLN